MDIDYLMDSASLQVLPRDPNWKTNAQNRIRTLREAPVSVRFVYVVQRLENRHDGVTYIMLVKIEKHVSNFPIKETFFRVYIYVMAWFIFRLAEGQAAHGVYVEVSSY